MRQHLEFVGQLVENWGNAGFATLEPKAEVEFRWCVEAAGGILIRWRRGGQCQLRSS